MLALLADDPEFLRNVGEFVIEFITANQSSYLRLSEKYKKIKGNSKIFFGTKTETMISNIRNGSAFQVAYDSTLTAIIIELIDKTALYQQNSKKYKRIVLKNDAKLRATVSRLLQKLLLAEFGR